MGTPALTPKAKYHPAAPPPRASGIWQVPLASVRTTLLMVLISGGLDLQCLGAGPEFPTRDWAGWQRRKQQILAPRPVVSDKGPGPRLCRKEFPQRQKVVKQVKSLLGGKGVQYRWIDTWADSERKSLSC